MGREKAKITQDMDTHIVQRGILKDTSNYFDAQVIKIAYTELWRRYYTGQ